MHSYWKYVDDLSVISSPTSSASAMQLAVDKVVGWSARNSMVLNTTKSCYIRFSFSRSDTAIAERQFPVPVVETTPLACTSQAKVLGVYLSSDLRWDAHVQHIVRTASKRIHMLIRLKSTGASREDLLRTYTVFIRPTVEYAAPVWHSSLSNSQSSEIEAIQKRSLKIILGSGYTSYQDALSLLNLTNLTNRRQALFTSFSRSLAENKRTSHLLPRRPPSRYPLRNEPTFKEPTCKTVRRQRSAVPAAIRLLNNAD